VTGTVGIDQEGIAVERVFREAYGHAVATLIRIFGDITLAEDAVQDAFLVASDRWRREAIPANPAAWIVTTAHSCRGIARPRASRRS
jgi:RNA polymerase sigma-70 factor, ECF subfamily